MEIFARDLWFRSQGREFLLGISGWITRKGLPGRAIWVRKIIPTMNLWLDQKERNSCQESLVWITRKVIPARDRSLRSHRRDHMEGTSWQGSLVRIKRKGILARDLWLDHKEGDFCQRILHMITSEGISTRDP